MVTFGNSITAKLDVRAHTRLVVYYITFYYRLSQN